MLLVAAEPREFAALVRLCDDVRRLAWPVRWAREGRLGGRRLYLVANGAGAARAAAAVDAAHAACRPGALVSMGFCGALDRALRPGEVFVATAVQGGGGFFCVEPPGASRGHASGLLATVDQVIGTAEEKRVLRASGAAAVDMEAAGVAGRARAYALPLFCVRAVTDTADESFATDFNAALRSDGSFDTIGLFRQALRNPAVRVPELLRLRRRCAAAARNLGEFIASCRF